MIHEVRVQKAKKVAVKEGGPDPANNFKLAQVIAKAKANNMPNDTIERGIKRRQETATV